MTSDETRRRFLEYFAERDHRVVPSSPLVLPNDPTLLFANAGMNQFKDVFTGRDRRDYVRAASSQKCMRVSGKHNDLEMVGRTPRHHTFFEMLGNFSFGDYFKEDAIRFAWELCTDVYGIDPERLWVTVFGGSDAADADDEAFDLWRDAIGVPAERILRLGEKENFWRMGDVGPCGPCSELHYDLGEDLRSVEGASNPDTDETRYIEVWNLVFMQFEQHADGRLEPLPAPSVDTGMGLERIASVLQGRRSNYDGDLFRPVLDAAGEVAGVTYGRDPEHDFSMRVIADHVRALCFLVADGVIPGSSDRGYVLRRILRRAIRHGRKLGLDRPFIGDVVPAVFETLGHTYPEIVAAREAIDAVARREETQFAETVSIGLRMLDEQASKLAHGEAGSRPVLPGKELFRLYDTFGLPLDLARDIADEQGFDLDEAGFEREMDAQRQRAQASWKGGAGADGGGDYATLASLAPVSFEGYATLHVDDAEVLALWVDGATVDALSEGSEGELVLDRTPFYAEAGGQVGDRGRLVSAGARAEVIDTKRPIDGLVVSRVKVSSGELRTGDRVRAEVDGVRRDAIRRNHTATHLAHAALREVVGPHVKQAGSLVAPDRLRFDFAHFAPLSDRSAADVEDLVNEKVLDSIDVETVEMPIDEALKAGAMALFGEKYGDRVRVVRIGDFSLELCGGTHCERSSEVGLFKLTQERGIASGTRRIEATTGDVSLERFREAQSVLRDLEELLSVPRAELPDELAKRLAQLKDSQRELDRLRVGRVRDELLAAAAEAIEISGVRYFARRVDGLESGELRDLADKLRGRLGSGVVVLGRATGEKASLLVAVTPDLETRAPAGDLVRELAKRIGGGGGGRKDLAEAGGRDPARLDDALRAGADLVRERLERA